MISRILSLFLRRVVWWMVFLSFMQVWFQFERCVECYFYASVGVIVIFIFILKCFICGNIIWFDFVWDLEEERLGLGISQCRLWLVASIYFAWKTWIKGLFKLTIYVLVRLDFLNLKYTNLPNRWNNKCGWNDFIITKVILSLVLMILFLKWVLNYTYKFRIISEVTILMKIFAFE